MPVHKPIGCQKDADGQRRNPYPFSDQREDNKKQPAGRADAGRPGKLDIDIGLRSKIVQKRHRKKEGRSAPERPLDHPEGCGKGSKHSGVLHQPIPGNHVRNTIRKGADRAEDPVRIKPVRILDRTGAVDKHRDIEIIVGIKFRPHHDQAEGEHKQIHANRKPHALPVPADPFPYCSHNLFNLSSLSFPSFPAFLLLSFPSNPFQRLSEDCSRPQPESLTQSS